jgi:hypothetical protein
MTWHDALAGPEEYAALRRQDAELESAESRRTSMRPRGRRATDHYYRYRPESTLCLGDRTKRRKMTESNLPLDDQAQIEDDAEVEPAFGVKEKTQAEDNVKIEAFDPDGGKVDERRLSNLVTTIGKNGIADELLASPTINKPSHMAIGTGGGGPAAGDTALTTELQRVALTSKTRSSNVVSLVGDFTTAGAITEAGIFDASSSGNLYARAVFAVLNVASGGSLRITWGLSVA